MVRRIKSRSTIITSWNKLPLEVAQRGITTTPRSSVSGTDINISEWLGLKVGDLVETKHPVYLERAGIHYALRYGTRGRPYVEQHSMARLPDDDPWVLRAEQNGWKKNSAKLDILIGLIVSLSFDEDDFLQAEILVSGRKMFVGVGEDAIDLFDYYADAGDVQRGSRKPTTEKLKDWEWRLVSNS
jgi:hypothetical protein